MENHRKKSTAAGRDLISKLPDEILHCIIARIKPPKTAAQTIALSKRWRALWGSYPAVDCDLADWTVARAKAVSDLQKFTGAATERFSRNKLLRMEALRLRLAVNGDGDGDILAAALSSCVEALLDLASERKAVEVAINASASASSMWLPGVGLPFRSLSNSDVEILRLEGIKFTTEFPCDELAPSLSSLRFLHLNDIHFNDERLLLRLIDSSPLLETLELDFMPDMRKFQISNLTNLKTIDIANSNFKKLHIVAPRLKRLHLRDMYCIQKFGLRAPHLLEFTVSGLDVRRIKTVISRLPSLRSLTLQNIHGCGRTLALSIPRLKKFTLWAPVEVEEIVLDAGPALAKFLLRCCKSLPDNVKKCEIRNSVAARQEVRFTSHKLLSWFSGLRKFITRFPQFDTVSIFSWYNPVTFIGQEMEMDHDLQPAIIKHLKLNAARGSDILDGLFSAYRPRFFTVVHLGLRSERLVEAFLSQYLQQSLAKDHDAERPNEHSSWGQQLKDVKIVTSNVDRVVEKEGSEEELKLMDVPKDVVSLREIPNQVCFMLTWC